MTRFHISADRVCCNVPIRPARRGARETRHAGETLCIRLWFAMPCYDTNVGSLA